jgi:O-antigen ligase
METGGSRCGFRFVALSVSPFQTLGFPILYGQVEEWIPAAVLVSVAVLMLSFSAFRAERLTFRITFCDMLFFLYMVYILFRMDEYWTAQHCLLSLYTLTVLYITVKATDRFHVRLIISVLIISLIVQVFYAFYRHDGTWNMIPAFTGIYHNTGIWGGFAGIVCVGIYGLLLHSGRNETLLAILLLFSSVVLLYSQSRAAWVGAFGGTAFLSLCFLRKKYGSRMAVPMVAVAVLSIPLLFFAGRALYQLKPVSADGRTYMWKIASGMIAENPLFGIGTDRF